MAINQAANAFIDRLAPSDRVAVAGIGLGAPSTPFTADRSAIKQAISRMVGQRQAEMRARTTSRWARRSRSTAAARSTRWSTASAPACRGRATSRPARSKSRWRRARRGAPPARQGDETTQALTALFTGLRAIDAPKTLIFISEGFITGDNQRRIMELGAMAAAARTSLYALKLDSQLFDVTSARAPINAFADRQVAVRRARDAGRRGARRAVHRHRHRRRRCSTASPSELSGYYLLGVESDGRDKDGKPHPIRVEVPRKGAIVRSRRQLRERRERSAGAGVAARGRRPRRSARRCWRRRCRCASPRSRCRGPSATRCSC